MFPQVFKNAYLKAMHDFVIHWLQTNLKIKNKGYDLYISQ